MKERIRLVMEMAGLSQQDFAQRLNLSAASISNIFMGRTNPTNNHVQAIHRAFPEINTNWLLFGEGEMLGNIPSLGIDGKGTVETTTAAIDVTSEQINLTKEANLFDLEFQTTKTPSSVNSSVRNQQNRTMNSPIHHRNSSEVTVKNYDNPIRKIKEIKVFFDDGTYESFVPSGHK